MCELCEEEIGYTKFMGGSNDQTLCRTCFLQHVNGENGDLDLIAKGKRGLSYEALSRMFLID